MSFEEGAGTSFQTLRGRNFPAIRQFTIFLENRVGQLLEVLRRFEGTGIRIVALSINDAAECAFVRFVVSDYERGREILERAGLARTKSGSAEVSDRNANYIVAHPGTTAADVIGLIEKMRIGVRSAAGVNLEQELKVW